MYPHCENFQGSRRTYAKKSRQAGAKRAHWPQGDQQAPLQEVVVTASSLPSDQNDQVQQAAFIPQSFWRALIYAWAAWLHQRLPEPPFSKPQDPPGYYQGPNPNPPNPNGPNQPPMMAPWPMDIPLGPPIWVPMPGYVL
jgi:hypothetical protein